MTVIQKLRGDRAEAIGLEATVNDIHLPEYEEWPEIFVPDYAVREMGDQLERFVPQLYDNSFPPFLVWFFVNNALRHPEQKGLVANQEEFKENVKHLGEETFINLLRDVETRKDWPSLLRNGTAYSFLILSPFHAHTSPLMSKCILQPNNTGSCDITERAPIWCHDG